MDSLRVKAKQRCSGQNAAGFTRHKPVLSVQSFFRWLQAYYRIYVHDWGRKDVVRKIW